MKKIELHYKGDDITVQDLYNNFVTRKKALNVTNDTVTYYNFCFRYFTAFFEKDRQVSEIDEKCYYDYITYLREKGTKDITINTYLRGIRAIFYFGMKEGYIKDFKVELIRCQKAIKDTYTDGELDILLKKPDIKKCDFQEYRNWVMINYLMATGNRISSMLALKIGDIDFDNGLITIRKTKNRNQQIIPLSTALSGILKEYLTYRQGNIDDELFCDSYGNTLSRYGAGKSIAKYNKKRGITKTSVHLFRHTFAKKWILNGWDIFRLQKILGHSSLDIVKEYVNMFSADLQNSFDNFNPLDRMNQNKKNKENKIHIGKP